MIKTGTVDATIVAKGKLEVRGGTLSVKKGNANKDSLEVGPDPLVVGRNESCDLVLDDKKVSAVHMEVVATERGVRVRDLGSRNGSFIFDTRVGEVYLTKPITVVCGDSTLEFNPSNPEEIAVPDVAEFGPLVGTGAPMRAIFEKLRKAAPTDLTVLILGETGTGKELVAQAIHQASSRANKPFVVVDCGAIPPSLAESALFGHERGSFTGAVDKRVSPFVEADGGTIFLDELGELPLDVQPKLLRALAEQRVKAVGSNNYRPVNVRVIAATRRDLVREVNAVLNQARPRNKKVFYNRGAELAWNLRRLVYDQKLNLAKMSPRLDRQMPMRKYEIADNGRIILEDKKEFRARAGFSPDHMDSAILANAGLSHHILKDITKNEEEQSHKTPDEFYKQWNEVYGELDNHRANAGAYRTTGVFRHRQIESPIQGVAQRLGLARKHLSRKP